MEAKNPNPLHEDELVEVDAPTSLDDVARIADEIMADHQSLFDKMANLMKNNDKIHQKKVFTVRCADVVTKENKDDQFKGFDVFLTLDIEAGSECFEITVQANEFVLFDLQRGLESLVYEHGMNLFPSPGARE